MSVIGPATYAQTRICVEEQRLIDPHNSQLSISNMSFIYRLCSGDVLSTTRLLQTLHKVIIKHQSLRTSLNFDTQTNMLMQRVIDWNDNPNSDLFTFTESTYETDEQLNNIMYDEQTNSQHFDLAHGLVFRCHIVYYRQIPSDQLVSDKDLLIFNFHHALFDVSSMDIFLHDLNETYTTGQLPTADSGYLRYLDCKYFYMIHITCFHSTI